MAQDVPDFAGTGAVLGQAGSHRVAQGVYQCTLRYPSPHTRPAVGLADQVIGSSTPEPFAVAVDE